MVGVSNDLSFSRIADVIVLTDDLFCIIIFKKRMFVNRIRDKINPIRTYARQDS